MELEIDQKVVHKKLGEGTVTDIYEHENGNYYFDVHFVTDDQENILYPKYKVCTFKLESYGTYFIQD